MNGVQKVVKYCAMAFAIFLSVVILGSIVAFISGMTTGIMIESGMSEELERINLSEQYTKEEIEQLGIREILIDCNAEITVEQGEVLSIDAYNVTEKYKIQCNGGQFSIVQDTDGFHVFSWFQDATEREEVVVRIPESFDSEKVTVDSGSGKVSVANVTTGQFIIDSGAGSVSVENVVAAKTTIDSGSGSIFVKNCSAEKTELYSGSGKVTVEDTVLGKCKLDTGSGSVRMDRITSTDMILDSGTGKVEMDGRIDGSAEFYTGSGSVSLVLDGTEEEYRIVTDSGSGTFRVNGEKREDGGYGKAVTGVLTFDSGSGSVNVDFREK